MKIAAAALAGLLVASVGWPLPAPAQTAPPPRIAEQASGAERQQRCGDLGQQIAELQGQLQRAFDPMERARLEGLLRALHEQDERCR